MDTNYHHTVTEDPPGTGLLPSKIERAIDLMHQAILLDSSKNFSEALKMYEAGIEFFLDALHSQVEGELAREAVVEKCQEYCNRAEELRLRINEKSGHVIASEVAEIHERHLPKAIEILTRARQEEARANCVGALRLYEQGMGHFDTVLGYDFYSGSYKKALQTRRKFYEEFMLSLKEKLHV